MLSDLEAILAAATPGRWEQVCAKYLSIDFGESPQVFRSATQADEMLILAACNAAPALIRVAKAALAIAKNGYHDRGGPDGLDRIHLLASIDQNIELLEALRAMESVQ